MNRIPSSAAKASNERKKPTSSVANDFNSMYPAWRLGFFDFDSKWGLASLLGEFVFTYSDTLQNALLESSIQELNKVYATLNVLNGKTFASVSAFWDKLHNELNSVIPSNLISIITTHLTRSTFFDKIYPKLKNYESNTWAEILSYSHRKKDSSASNNHPVEIGKLSQEAQRRLAELKMDDREEIFSLRLEGKVRIYGFRTQNYLDILWIDLNHEIYKL